MFNDWKRIIPETFSDESRVWIYQCNRTLRISEALELEPMLEDFVATWTSHGAKVKGYGNLLFGQFIIIMADEAQTGVSGCSTDSSVRLIKQVETRFQVSLFNRTDLAFIIKDKVEVIPMAQLDHALRFGFVGPDTTYFNNTVLTKKDLLAKWMIPVKESWLASRLQAATQG